MLSASRRGSPVLRAVPEMGDDLDPVSLHPHEHLRRAANQLLVAELQEELVGAGAGLLKALEQLRGALGKRSAEGLTKHYLVVVAPLHSLANGLYFRHVLVARVVADDLSGRLRGHRGNRVAGAFQGHGGEAVFFEVVLVALDPLPLAIHEADVVAQVEVQVLRAGAGQAELDGIELEQQVVSESAHQGQARIAHGTELLGQRAQDGERRRLLAAFLFREKCRQRLQTAHQRAVALLQGLPMRVPGQHREEQPVQDFAARVEGAEFQPALPGQDLERGPHRGDVPARVSAGVLVT